MPACIFTNLPEIDPNTLWDRMRVPFTTTNSGSAALSREIDSPPFADSIRTTLEATGVESSPDSRWRRLWTELNRISPEVVLVPGYYTLPGLASAFWARLHGRRAVQIGRASCRERV